MPHAVRGRAVARLLIALLAGALVGCVVPSGPQPARWDLFTDADGADPFAPRVRLWQASERLQTARERLWALDGAGAEAGSPDTPLARARREFHRAERARAARATLAWVQAQSREGYRPDPGGDAWPILRDLLTEGRDDCDGWELLTFSTLRALGFGNGELYRAILTRPPQAPQETPAYHMVTLWFPGDERSDPWVLDPTASISRSMVRLSDLGAWRPVRLFDEVDQFAAALLPAPR